MKLFIAEQGSDKMVHFARTKDARSMAVSALAQIEATSAISRLRGGSRITRAESALMVDGIAAQIRSMVEQPVSPRVLQAAAFLIERHDLRTLDAVQLGSALIVRDLYTGFEMRLIASDNALLAAARNEGFEVWNPAEK